MVLGPALPSQRVQANELIDGVIQAVSASSTKQAVSGAETNFLRTPRTE